MLTAATVLLLTAGSVAVQLMASGRTGEAPDDLGLIAALTFTVGLLPPCVMLPAVYKFGMEKGRIVYYRLIGIVSQYWFQRNFSSYDSSVAGVTEPTITGKNVQNRFPESANIDAPQNITTINSTERQYFFIM